MRQGWSMDHPFFYACAFIFRIKNSHDNYIIREPLHVKKDIYGIIDLKNGKRIREFSCEEDVHVLC